jgi:hypothetical protein
MGIVMRQREVWVVSKAFCIDSIWTTEEAAIECKNECGGIAVFKAKFYDDEQTDHTSPDTLAQLPSGMSWIKSVNSVDWDVKNSDNTILGWISRYNNEWHAWFSVSNASSKHIYQSTSITNTSNALAKKLSQL